MRLIACWRDTVWEEGRCLTTFLSYQHWHRRPFPPLLLSRLVVHISRVIIIIIGSQRWSLRPGGHHNLQSIFFTAMMMNVLPLRPSDECVCWRISSSSSKRQSESISDAWRRGEQGRRSEGMGKEIKWRKWRKGRWRRPPAKTTKARKMMKNMLMMIIFRQADCYLAFSSQ